MIGSELLLDGELAQNTNANLNDEFEVKYVPTAASADVTYTSSK